MSNTPESSVGQTVGPVLGLAIRPVKAAPMQTCDRIDMTIEHGIEGNPGKSQKRGLTLLSKSQWQTTLGELNAELDWTTRRANVLVDAPSLEQLIGQTIRIGEVTIEVLGETNPCSVMDRALQGLNQALVPECRGGVFGRILCDGAIRVGDVVQVET